MSPLEFLRGGGTAIGENWIEQERAEPSGSDGEGKGGELAPDRSGGVDGVKLSAEQADLGAVSGGGAKALQHGNCGRVSNRAYRAEFRAAVRKQVKARYEDFGPTLASEHLASDDGLQVHAETAMVERGGVLAEATAAETVSATT